MSDPRLLTYNGETLSVSDWARKLGCDPNVISNRLNQQGLTVAQALSTPVRAGNRYVARTDIHPEFMAMDGQLSAEEYLAITDAMADGDGDDLRDGGVP